MEQGKLNLDPRAKTRNEMTMAQSFAVMKLLESEYLLSKKNDTEFAKYVTEKLGFGVKGNQLRKRRVSIGLPSNRPSNRPQKKEKPSGRVIDRIAALEAAILALTVRVQAVEGSNSVFDSPKLPMEVT